MKSRPIVVIDTSVFIQDAMSKTHKGAASQALALLPGVATVVLCDDIRGEIIDKCADHLGWTEKQVLARYGPLFDAAVWVTPVEEQPWHQKVVQNDPDDTMLPRTAEAVFTQRGDLVGADQDRFIVSENRKHLVPGSNYASFMFVTSHGLLERISG